MSVLGDIYTKLNMRIRNGINYFERVDIIKKYKYSQTVFDNKSKLGLKKYPNQIFHPYKGVWYIHPDIVKEIFQPKRKPNRKNKEGMKSWVIEEDWMFIGCMYPRRSTMNENIKKIQEVFDRIKSIIMGSDIVLCFTVEPNKSEEKRQYSERHYHTHFLLNVSKEPYHINIVKEIKKILKDFSDSRPFFERYKPIWELQGKRYTVKEILSTSSHSDYLTFKTKSKHHV